MLTIDMKPNDVRAIQNGIRMVANAGLASPFFSRMRERWTDLDVDQLV